MAFGAWRFLLCEPTAAALLAQQGGQFFKKYARLKRGKAQLSLWVA
jgi:hypothetical protein